MGHVLKLSLNINLGVRQREGQGYKETVNSWRNLSFVHFQVFAASHLAYRCLFPDVKDLDSLYQTLINFYFSLKLSRSLILEKHLCLCSFLRYCVHHPFTLCLLPLSMRQYVPASPQCTVL